MPASTESVAAPTNEARARSHRHDNAARSGACRDCWLAFTCFPARLTQPEAAELSAVVRHADPLDRDEPLFRVGEPFDRVFVVRSGCLRSSIQTRTGDTHVIGFHLPGDVIGFDAEFGERHSCDAVALERTSVCSIDVDDLHRLSGRSTGLQRQLFRLLTRKIVANDEHVLMMGRTSAYERVALFLDDWSCRVARTGRSGTSLWLPMRREDIASYLGLVTETASRAFSRLQDDGIISVQARRVEVLDPERLREVSGR